MYFRVRVCVCVCVYMCARAREQAPLPLFLKLKYHLCIARLEACKELFKYLVFYGEICNIFALHLRMLSVTQPGLYHRMIG